MDLAHRAPLAQMRMVHRLFERSAPAPTGMRASRSASTAASSLGIRASHSSMTLDDLLQMR